MRDVAQIGQCIGCGKGPRRLDRGVCSICLEHPKRGRRWAETSQRIRQDPEFALETYNSIGIERPERAAVGKLLFIRMYGLPKGAIAPIPDLKICEPYKPDSN